MDEFKSIKQIYAFSPYVLFGLCSEQT